MKAILLVQTSGGLGSFTFQQPHEANQALVKLLARRRRGSTTPGDELVDLGEGFVDVTAIQWAKVEVPRGTV